MKNYILLMATWNVNGIQARIFEIDEPLTERSPNVLAIQKTKLKPNQALKDTKFIGMKGNKHPH